MPEANYLLLLVLGQYRAALLLHIIKIYWQGFPKVYAGGGRPHGNAVEDRIEEYSLDSCHSADLGIIVAITTDDPSQNNRTECQESNSNSDVLRPKRSSHSADHCKLMSSKTFEFCRVSRRTRGCFD